jgi:UDP:flavonoid glycosyltransferase YjiC (YdhE family)
MSRILAYTSPARGHLYPLVPILDELAARGHEIAVRTLGSQLELLRERGFSAAPISSRIEELVHDDYKARTPQARLRRGVAKFGERATLEIPDLRDAIEAERPDALLVDCMTWGASAAAEAWGGAWAQWFPYPLPLPAPGVPPFGPGLKPASGPLGRLRDAALRPLLIGSMQKTFLPPVNSARAAVGARPLDSISEMFTVPPLLLYMTAEPFEYPRSEWPECVRMVGPCCWDPPAEPPAWLNEITRPIVLVSTSSEFQDDGRLVTTALEALADEDVQVVATVPAAELPSGALPANARVEPFVAHAPILARAACAVTHGGAGVTQKALAAGVPVCVVPFGRDQLEVARRVEVAGAGARLPVKRLTRERLRSKIREATEMRAGARRVAEGFARAGGAVAAANAFEELLGRRNAGSEPRRSPASEVGASP